MSDIGGGTILNEYNELGQIKSRIIALIKKNDGMIPKELGKYLGMSPQALSPHLTSLKKQGWIKSSKDGAFRPYVVVQEKLDELTNYVQSNLGSKFTPKTDKEQISTERTDDQ